MPLYDYRCENCSLQVEVLQGINEARLTDCPECGQATFNRLASAPSFNFKGGGWYKDLYGSAGSGETKKSGPSTTKTTTDSKPSAAKKSETKAAS